MELTVHHFNSGIDPNSLRMAACFDLDWTLVRPESSKFPRNYSDNVIMNNRITVLKEYIKMGYGIVIFTHLDVMLISTILGSSKITTNQKLTNKENLQFKYNRISDIMNKFKVEGIPLVIYMATADDKYRKPNVGMWDQFRRSYKPKV